MAIKYEWAERLLVAAAFFSTSYLIDINFVSMEMYRGDTRGFEFGVTDWMVISLILVMHLSPRWKKRKLTYFPPNSIPILLYLLMAMISVAVSYVAVYSGFGLLKIIRGISVYWVAFNYLRSEEDIRFVLMVLAAIVCMEFFLVVQQRMVGVYRPPGSTPHSNTLAVYINMMNMIFFSFMLGDKGRKSTHKMYWICFCLGSVMVVASLSRGALVSMVLGYTFILMLSFYDKPSTQKWKVIGILLLVSLPVLVKVAPVIIDRFVNAPEESGASRGYANQAALAMAKDHPFGVGLNNYSYAINETNYVRFIDDPVDRGIVHNIYLLHASELGWGGLVTFLIMIGNFFVIGIKLILKRRNNVVSILATGIVVAMFTLWFQSMLEWLFRQTYVTVEFFMLAGFLAALSRVDVNIIQERKNVRRKKVMLWMAMNRKLVVR